MADILIERCTLRVVRRQGWSWGPSPERLLEHALRLLPDLLAAKLEGLFPDDAETVYEAPVRIRLKLPPIGMDGDVSPVSAKPLASGHQGSDSFDLQLQSAICSALGKPLTVPPESASHPSVERWRLPQTVEELLKPSSGRETLQHFLRALVQRNELRDFFASFSAQELEVWHAALHRVPSGTANIQEQHAVLIAEELEVALSSHQASPAAERATLLRVRLVLAAETAARLRLSVNDPDLWRILDARLPLSASPSSSGSDLTRVNDEPGSPEAEALTHVAESAVCTSPTPVVPSQICGTPSSNFDEWTTHVHSALPFLLLGPLHRMGYWSALGAVFDAARLTSSSHLFAAAFAYKVLDPPERGWRRSLAAQHAGAVFAGSLRPVSDEALHEFSRLFAAHTGPLDRWLTNSVDAGRDKTSPVFLRRAESEHLSDFLFFDPDGCFPLAWVEDTPAAVSLLQNLGSPVVLVSSEASGPRVLQELHQAQLVFVTEVPPVRHESWRPVTQGTSRLGWTNHAHPSSEFLVRAARMLEPSSLEAASFWEQLGIMRPAVPRAKLLALERSVTLAASVALGILAWQLWKERGRTTPQLALERLGDLEASVRLSGGTLQIGLPRGRRHSELLQAGLLAPVPDIPWLDGRRVEFAVA